jgi:hypothetical protein
MGEHFLFFYRLKKQGYKVATSSLLKFKDGKSPNKEYEKYRLRNFRKEALEKIGFEEIVWK